MTHLPQDVRYAMRVFTRAPAFTATALLVLALGIGSNVAVFTVVNALVLKPAGGRAPGTLVGLYMRERGRPDRYRLFSHEDYRAIRGASPAFSGVLAQRFTPVLVTEGDASRRSFAALVSADYFATLAVAPALGRGFRPADEGGASPVVVVSHAYWKRTGATAAALGRAVRINGVDLTVVGVAPAGFSGTMALFSPEFWLPLGTAAVAVPAGPTSSQGSAGASRPDLSLVGRLQPGVSRDAAGQLATRLAASLPHGNRDLELEIVVGEVSRLSASAGPPNVSDVHGALLFLLLMSGVVLLIAALNLANMLLARGSARRREMAIRMAIGARRGRMVSQLVTESLALSLAGAALGAGLAWVGTQVLAATLQPILPMVIALDGSPDWRVLGAAVAFAMVSTLAFGLWPAIGLARTDVQGQLRAGTSRPPLVRLTARNLLVVSQLALSLVLLAAAGIFIKGARNAADADPGYPLDRGLVVTIDATAGGDPGSRACDRARDLLERVRRMPGVQSASLASSIAFGVALQGRRVRRADAPAAEARYAVFTVAGAQYFDTLGIPVLRGREFADAEERGISAGRGVIVNEPLARALWPDGDPVGQRVQFSAGDASAWDDPREVVGVVRGVRQSLFDTMPVPQAFVPLAGAPLGGDLYLHLRPSHGGSAEALMLQRVRQELRDAYPTLPVLSVLTLGQHRDRSIYLWMARAGAQLFTLLGLAALALAALGVYGVKAFLVAQRTREIGIRVALGATRADIVRLVIADGLGWTGAALCAGLAIAVAVSRVLASWVYGVGTIEPATLTLTVAILMATSLLACYLPARRSTALPPIIALRQE